MENLSFDTGCLAQDTITCKEYVVTSRDGISRIKKDGLLLGTLNQSRFKLLAAECAEQHIGLEILCDSILGWIASVRKLEQGRGICSHQFGAGLQAALEADGIIGCCPLVAPSSFPHASWNGVTADWWYLIELQRPVIDLLCSSPEEQRRLTRRLDDDGV